MNRHVVAKARPRVLAVALLAALAAPGMAFGQTAKEQELEARIAQLEAQVRALLSQQQQQQSELAETRTQVTEVRTAQAQAPAAAAADGKGIQRGTIMTAANPGTTFSYGGMIKFDAMVTDTSDGRIADGSAGRLFYVPSTIPVGADGADGGDAYTDQHAQFSRFWFSADHATEGGDKFKAYIEADMFGGGSNALLGNETSTNTYGVSLRHAYVSWNRWLAGQTWSNFMDVGALPDAVDFVGVTDGTVFVRQAQLRYTNGPWSFSAENPQTTVQSYSPFNPVAGARFNTGDNVLPDFTARWITRGDWGHFTVAGLVRQFKAADETETGAAVSASGKFNLGTSDDIRYAVNAGQGIGRYLAFGMGSDVMQDANGDLHALDGYGGFVAWRHVFSPLVRTNLMYSAAHYDNDEALVGFGVTERAHSLHANVIYSPFPKLDVGAELIFGQRFLEDDREGDLTRVHTHVRYTF
ncbi:DcaP family trimeric outer membrane transporter [Luteimonas sp. RD2P54]|uniref:DcaP family trimeric outer membrane transporter n=1 Tax=Luteimonas endophytica TaxID=3042023 RepID=A0ABT6J5A1_9GAMM|nr:DcaP family trimeric outer membrane transporter [Luteimonas endophytica]MDH5822002.1 DcaP family trimeric outer membrane transporter [Luteimonas endophytica]